MPPETEPAARRESHLAVALRRRENRVAALVTLTIGLVVLGISRIPLSPGFAVDARDTALWSATRDASFSGFEAPDADGRMVTETTARVVLNRPLPSRFILEVEAQSRPSPAAARVTVGAHSQVLRLGSESDGQTVEVLQVDAPPGTRVIQFDVAPGSGNTVTLRRLSVRAP